MKILVTGATGFLGRAFVRYVTDGTSECKVEKIAAFARSESRLARLTAQHEAFEGYRPFLGDVRDYRRLVDACHGIDFVVHAAALKRVDDGSYNPGEMVETNIIGTQNVIRAATEAGVKKVVLVSSDKAVAPINVYGATKFVAEQFAISNNSISAPRGTSVSVVRYGNVIGSTGSVLEAWGKQRDAGTPLTVTDSNMTRFLMTVQDACGLIFHALLSAQAGSIFIPILKSARLLDMAEAFAPGHPVNFTGFRVGGEKLAEALLNYDEERRAFRLIATDSWSALPFSQSVIVVPPDSPSWTTDRHGITDTGAETSEPVGGIEMPYQSDSPSCLMQTQEEVGRFIDRAMKEGHA